MKEIEEVKESENENSGSFSPDPFSRYSMKKKNPNESSEVDEANKSGLVLAKKISEQID